MEKVPSDTDAGSRSNEKRHRQIAALVAVVCVAGWMTFMLTFHQESAFVTLPGGTTVRFLEVTEGARGGFLHENGSGLTAYVHSREIKESAVDKVRGQLPRWIDRNLPGKRATAGRTSGYGSASTHAFWFVVDGPFNAEDWRFFWVDDQGYEAEVEHWYVDSPGNWLGVEGNVPRMQERLHLKIRSRTGEKDASSGTPNRGLLPGIAEDGILGEVAAEMKLRNPLQRSSPAIALTAQPLPAKVSVGGHQLILNGATRARITSDLTFGLHLDLALEGGRPVTNLFSLEDWSIEDGNGNVMVPGNGILSETGQLWDCAPWSDTSVWKIRFVPVYTDPKGYETDEILVVDPMPMPEVKPRAKASTSIPWVYEGTVKGHTVRVDTVRYYGTSDVMFKVTVSPPINGHSLQLLHAADETGSQTCETPNGRQKYASSFRFSGSRSSSTLFWGRCRRPVANTTLSLTLAFKEVVPVEFTIRPGFRP